LVWTEIVKMLKFTFEVFFSSSCVFDCDGMLICYWYLVFCVMLRDMYVCMEATMAFTV